MPYFGSAPSSSALTAAQIDAGAVDSSEIATGAVDLAHLSASGTAGSGNFLRGDNSWQAAGGDLSFGGDTFGANKVIGANDAYSLSLETNGNTALTIDTTGAITKPLQPCVQVHPASTQSNIAPDGTVTLVWGTERFDVNGDFSANTFTAPVTGKYIFLLEVRWDAPDVGADYINVQIVSSNRSYIASILDYSILGSDPERWVQSANHIVDMDVSDTATVTVYISSGAAQTDLHTASTLSIGLLA